jgi:hypothetical protein
MRVQTRQCNCIYQVVEDVEEEVDEEEDVEDTEPGMRARACSWNARLLVTPMLASVASSIFSVMRKERIVICVSESVSTNGRVTMATGVPTEEPK